MPAQDTDIAQIQTWGPVPQGRDASVQSTLTIKAFDSIYGGNADFECLGANDDRVIQAAVDALSSKGGHIVLSDGTFNFGAGAGGVGVLVNSTIGERSVRIEGQGRYATVVNHPRGTKAFKFGTRASNGNATIGSGLSHIKIKSQNANADGTTIGVDTDGIELCRFEDILIEDCDIGFVLRNLDRCSLMETRVGNPKLTAYKLVQAGPSVGGHNNWGTLTAINAEFALSENNSKGIHMTKEGDGSNPLARIAWIGSMLFCTLGVTGAIGLHVDDIGVVGTGFYSALFENNPTQIKTNSEAHIAFYSCELLRSNSNSDYIVRAGAFGSFTFYDCAFQRATVAFQGDSGFPRFTFHGGNKNDGNIGSLFGGSIGGRLGTDTQFAGSDTLALGTSASDRMDYVFSTHGVFEDMRLTDGISAPATEAGKASLFIDVADGDLKVKFGDGTVKTIVVDT